jgi:hypothetical protein
MPPRLLAELTDAGYLDLDVLLVPVPLDEALRRAEERWWTGREAGGLGGRFTPRSAIESLYRPDGTTTCEENAHRLVDDATAAHLRVRLKG